MKVQSSSFVTNSLPQAGRVVDQLIAAKYTPEEISVLNPDQGLAKDSEPDRPRCESRNILVSVHLEGGCEMGRAEEIFGRARSEAPPQVSIEDDRPQSWVKPLFTKTSR